MGKYLAVFKNSLQGSLIYRFNTFSYLFAQIFSFGAFFYLWASIYHQGGQIGGYTLAQLVVYYLVVNFLRLAFKGTDTAWIIGDEIRLGQLNSFLLLPMKYFWRKFYAALGIVAFRGLVALLAFSILAFSLYHFGIIFPFEPLKLFYFLISAILGFVIDFQFFYIIGLMAFWMALIMGLNFTMQNISSFLSGGIIPLDLLPGWFVAINNWLPFKYISYVPVSIFNGRLQPDLFTFLIPIAWIVILGFCSRWIFNRGLKKYEGTGA